MENDIVCCLLRVSSWSCVFVVEVQSCNNPSVVLVGANLVLHVCCEEFMATCFDGRCIFEAMELVFLRCF